MKQQPAVLVLRIVVVVLFVCGGVLYLGRSSTPIRSAANAGASQWVSEYSGTNQSLNGVAFTDSQTGWAVLWPHRLHSGIVATST
jgi:hypothetical protein